MSRKRKENFTEFDKNTLAGLIKPHRVIIESKKNDLRTLQYRAKIWETISNEFNSDSAIRVHRTIPELKDLYKRLKVDAKKQFTEYNKQIRCTGGGETYVTITCISKESNLRPDKKIRSISGPTRLISMP